MGSRGHSIGILARIGIFFEIKGCSWEHSVIAPSTNWYYKFTTNLQRPMQNLCCCFSIIAIEKKQILIKNECITCQFQPSSVSDGKLDCPISQQDLLPLEATIPENIRSRISVPCNPPSMPLQTTVTGYIGGLSYWAAILYMVSK